MRFGPGIRGDLVGRIQHSLVDAGVALPKIDDVYGHDTELAIREFQTRQNMAATGVVDETTWQSLVKAPLPELRERALQLTAAFEGHNYTLAVGNFDGAWLTWGIIGFTLCNGEVQAILSAVDQTNPECIDQAFGPEAAMLRGLLTRPLSDCEAWAVANTVDGGGLAEPWRASFAAFGEFPEVRAEQRRRAFDRYFAPALKTAARYKLESDLGIALTFDIHVQNGGINPGAKSQIELQLAGNPNCPELKRREIIANAVADNARPKYREDVRVRKLAIARGGGQVHGRSYNLENWGLV
jgi:hypothetical protein